MRNLWVLELAIVFIVALGLHWALRRILRLIHRFTVSKGVQQLKAGDFQNKQTGKSQAASPILDQGLENAFLTPLRFLVWIIAAFYITLTLNEHLGPIKGRGEEWFRVMRDCSIVVVLSWIAMRWKRQKEVQWFNGGSADRMDPVTGSAIGKLITMAILLIAILSILHITGVNIVPLLAFGGIGAATLGFAAKDVIANFFGGLMLLIIRPFALGEEILIEKEKIQGIIERIGWCSTLIRDREKRVVYLPNSSFSHLFVVNCSRRTHRRICETYSIDERHVDALGGLVEVLERALNHSPLVDPKESCIVSLEHISGGVLELSMEVYTTKTGSNEYRKARQEIILMVAEILKQQKIGLAIPRTLGFVNLDSARQSQIEALRLRNFGDLLESAKFNEG